MAYTFGIDKEATGERIRQLRKQRNLRVTDISEYMGFEDPQAVYKWQRGQTLPSLDNMVALAKLFRVPIEAIIVIRGDDTSSSPLPLSA